MSTLRQRPARLGLGGHSYIEQLGNDPQPSFDEQCALVSTCLDAGIHLFDTTYYQERVALGRIMRTLDRRPDAEIMAWNFFKQAGKEHDLVSWTPYEPHHIATMLEELQTNHIDLLVIHAEDDVETLRSELALAYRWMDEGKVRQVGLGMLKLDHLQVLPAGHRITHVLAPFNAFNRGAAAIFTRAKDMSVTKIHGGLQEQSRGQAQRVERHHGVGIIAGVPATA